MKGLHCAGLLLSLLVVKAQSTRPIRFQRGCEKANVPWRFPLL